MDTTRWILAALASVALALAVSAQESEETAPPAEQAPPADAPPPQAQEERTLEEIFIPSEEIAADEEVTFPINI